MRIECDNCSAKYSIADEKVIGKLFKVRCKKCTNMIMVDGTTLGGDDEPEEATRVFDASAADAAAEQGMGSDGAATAAAVWFVVIDGQQTGPLTFTEVQEHAVSGAVDPQTFAWREGMDDWFPIADIPDLAGATRAPAAQASEAPEPAPEPAASSPAPDVDDEFDDEATRVVSTTDDEGAFSFAGVTGGHSAIDSFSASVPTASAPASAGGGGDLFAGVAAGSSSVSSAAGPSGAADTGGGASMVGERNESSVLFSLSDLTSSRSAQPKQDELPRTEGSGLIDIRVLAQAQSQVSDNAAAAPTAASSAGLPITPLVPVAPRRRNTGLMVGIGVGVAVLIGLVVALVVLLLEKPEQPGPAVADTSETVPADEVGESGDEETVAAAGAEEIAEDVAEGSAEPAVAAEGSGEGSGDAVAAAEGSGASPEDDSSVEADGGSETVVAAAPATSTNAATASPTPTPTRPSTAGSTTTTSTTTERAPPSRENTEDRPRGDDAVNSALSAIRGGSDRDSDSSGSSGSSGSSATTETAAAAGPTELSRSQVQSTVRRYRSRLESCRSDGGDRAQYNFRWVIQPSGAVTNAQARQSDDVAQCAVGVIRAMQFPRFNGDAQRIPDYPMQL